jgi:hypothetical protein
MHFQNWLFNVGIVLMIITGAFLRSVIAQRDNRII